MTRQLKNNMNTDLAWRRLFERLRHDGLIPEENIHGRRRRSIRLLTWTAAAAVLLFCAGAITIALLHKDAGVGDDAIITLRNGEGSPTLVTTLEDGSIVYLAGDSRLYYPGNIRSGKREVSLLGRAMFDVQSNAGRPFTINAATAQVEVIGTVFDVSAADDGTFELSVLQGRVKITSNTGGQQLYADAGQTVAQTSAGSLVASSTHGDPFAYYNAHIRFKDEKLSDILRIINNQGETPTLQTVPALENRKITVTFTNAAPESVAELICAAFNLLCKKENNTILITER
ncbi:MAG: FecR family protein [Tannerellaceae bacterium]|jgi:ferric-dicitrate binding protein FerR (iron transport regulator)|nr:FecR family protein [Tannerellaceae bacterium]